MSASAIEDWIKGLGRSHPQLLAAALIPGNELSELFPGDNQVYLEPQKGISMTFREDDRRLESFCITLVEAFVGEQLYTGELPAPYSTVMNKLSVNALFGTPAESSAPTTSPPPIGLTGGWDAYLLDPTAYPNSKVIFHYNDQLQVDYIAFSLID